MKARRKSKIAGGRKRQLVEEALRESESLYRQLIRGVPVASYITDEQGFLTLWNEAAEGLWGRIPTAGQDRWCGSWRLYTADGSFLPHEECPMAVAITERRAISGVEALLLVVLAQHLQALRQLGARSLEELTISLVPGNDKAPSTSFGVFRD